jgi:hypothetical protein
MNSLCVGFCAIAISSAFLVSSARGADAPPSTNPITTLSERQASLLLQLADAETNIKAINKALKQTGYKVGIAYDQIEGSAKANQLMDRRGGGPVPWDQFYGKTAMDFYYHSSADLKVRNGGHDLTSVDAHYNGSRLTTVDRPAQFDYIYRANATQTARADEQIASLLQDQAALLARRHMHEADQTRLWALLSWESVRDREIPFHPLYRFALQPAGDAHAQIMRAAILYLRTADRAISAALRTIETDPDTTIADLQQRSEAAYEALQPSMADAVADAQLKPDELAEAERIKALCKQTTEEFTIIADNYHKALDSDVAKEDASKLAFRSELQSSLARVAPTMQELDTRLLTAANAWHITPQRGCLTPDKLPDWPQNAKAAIPPLGPNAAANPTPVGPPTQSVQATSAVRLPSAPTSVPQTTARHDEPTANIFILHLDASLGASAIDEAAMKSLPPDAQAIVNGLRFGKLQLPDRRGLTYFHIDAKIDNQSPRARIEGEITAVARVLCVDGDGKKNVTKYSTKLDIGQHGLHGVGVAPRALYLDKIRVRNNGDERPANVYVEFRIGDVPFYRQFLNAPNGEAWWTDDSLVIKEKLD